MRQTGRSSRIASFAVDQLLSVGQVIVTDHTVFEYPGSGSKPLKYLIKKVEEGLRTQPVPIKLISDVKQVGDIYVIHFKLERDEKSK